MRRSRFQGMSGPVRALDVLGLYARCVDRAQNTTAADTVIDWDTHTITTAAPATPPALLQPGGTSSSSTRPPPLTRRPARTHPRRQASEPFTDGAVLVL